MNKQEFMNRLEGCLADIPPGEREEALQYYRDYLDDAGEQEQEALEALGTPEQVAESIKLGLREGNEFGAFTESGFHMNIEDTKDKVSVYDSGQHEKQGFAGGQSGQGGYQETGRQGGPQNGWQQAGGSWQGGPQNGWQQAGGSWQGGPQNGWQQAGGGWQGGPQYGQPACGNQQKRKRSVGEMILLVLACIVLLPIVVPVGAGILIVIFSFLVTLIVFLACLVLAGLLVLGVGLLLVIVAISNLIIAPAAAVYLMGGGLICSGIGLAMTALMVWLTVKVVPVACQGFINLCRLPFRRRRV